MLGCDKDMKLVKEYRLGGEFMFTAPQKGEEFFLVPYQFYGEASTPFIEIYKDGSLIRTVNCAYVAEIRICG